MISQTAEYALRAVIHLAEHYGNARTTHQIAEETRVPPDYLSKVLKMLVNADLVSSQRGLYGGFRLRREPSDLTIIEVVEVLGTLQRFRECPLQREHTPGPLCPLHQLLDDSMAQIEDSFRRMTIGELVETNGDSPGLCDKSDRVTPLHINGGSKTNGNGNGNAHPKSSGAADPLLKNPSNVRDDAEET